jgi:hypothetical protein
MSLLHLLRSNRRTQKYFSKREALEKLDRRVFAIRNLNGIPRKAIGTVVRAIQHNWDQWVIMVEWKFTDKMETVRSFTKSEYNRYVKEMSD